jgi:hypothetical protein
MIYTNKIHKKISMLLLFSFLFSVFVAPTMAQAGILGNILGAIKPYAGTLGKLGGAVAGAVMGASFMPPLGILAGGIAGYVVGGILATYATGSLTKLATLGGAALGVMAGASMGPVGYVLGAIGGGLLGKIAMGLLYKLDKEATGSFLFSPAVDSLGEPIMVGASVIPEASAPSTSQTTTSDVVILADKQDMLTDVYDNDIIAVEQAYQEAYKNYIVAVRSGSTQEIREANEKYKEAYNRYQKVTGKTPE